MDQIAATGLKLLAEYKKALDKAKEQVEVARQLSRRIELFEVTVSMIPSRGDKALVQQMVEAVPGQEYVSRSAASGEGLGKAAQAQQEVQDAAQFVSSAAQEAVASQVMNIVSASPLGQITDLMQSFAEESDGTPIIGELRPAEVLQKMRDKGESDLEVSFVAMSFLIHNALKIVDDAVKDVLKIGIPNMLWLVMPWKIYAQNELGKGLVEHLEALDKFNAQLQSAISIASYCVSLEQLENVLDATSMLTNKTIRDFWKRKIGVSNIKVKMSELQESFFSHIEDEVKNYKLSNHHLRERIVNIRDAAEVSLGRFISNLWNSNGDEWLTVYELNMNTEHFGKDGDAIKLTTQKVFELDQLFTSKIEFFPLSIDEGEDGTLGNEDDELICRDTHEIHAKHGVVLHSNDIVVTVKPFQRLTLLCKVPRFNKSLFPHDGLTIMRYERVNSVKALGREANFSLRELEETRTYLSPEINEQFYGRNLYAWNAPVALSRGKEKVSLTLPDGSTISENFVETKIDDSVSEEEEGGAGVYNESNQTLAVNKKSHKLLEEGGVTSMTTVLYTPTIRKPGIYTVRLVLDEIEFDDNDDLQNIATSTHLKKKMAVSQKNYYYNRSIEEREIFTSTRGAMICTTIQGLNIINFKHFVDLTLKLLELDIQEYILKNDHVKMKYACEEKEKFIKATADKVAQYELALSEKERKKEENDIKSLRDLLHMDAEATKEEVAIAISIDDLLSQREEEIAPPGPANNNRKKQQRRSIVKDQPPAERETPLVSLATERDEHTALAVEREAVEIMHENPLFGEKKQRAKKEEPPQKNKPTLSGYYEQIAPLVALILNHASDPAKLVLEKEKETRKDGNENIPIAATANQPKKVSKTEPAEATKAVTSKENKSKDTKATEVHRHKHKITQTLAVDLYASFAKETLAGVKNEAFSAEQLELKKIVLEKIVVLLRMTRLIISVEEFIRNTLTVDWRDKLHVIGGSVLQQVENSFREHKGLVVEHNLLRENVRRAIESSPINPSDAHVLVDLENDLGDTLAVKALVYESQFQLFLQYFRIKISLYTLDAREAMDNKDIERLFALEQRMMSLNDLMVSASKGKLNKKERSTTVEIYKAILNVFMPSVETNKVERRRNRVYKENVIIFENRAAATKHLSVFLKNLVTYIEQLQSALDAERVAVGNTAKGSALSSTLLREKIDSCLKIREEVEATLANAKLLHSIPMDVEMMMNRHNDKEITIDGLKPANYLIFARLFLLVLDLDLQQCSKAAEASVVRELKAQELRVKKEGFLRSVEENLSRFEAKYRTLPDEQSVKELKALIESHSSSGSDAIGGSMRKEIDLSKLIDELPSERSVQNREGSRRSSLANQLQSQSSKMMKTKGAIDTSSTTLRQALEDALRAYDVEKKKIFPSLPGSDVHVTAASSRLAHLLNKIPRTAYDELVEEIKSAMKKLADLESGKDNKKSAKEKEAEMKLISAELEKIGVVLSRIVALFKLTKLILDLDCCIDNDMNQWMDSLPHIDTVPLSEISASFAQQNALFYLQQQWIAKIRNDLEKTSAAEPSETRVLLDLENDDADRVAREALVTNNQTPLFVRYYTLKLYLFTLDATEAIALNELSRLEQIEKKVIALNNMLIKTLNEAESNKKNEEVDQEKEKEKEKDKDNKEKDSNKRILDVLRKEGFFKLRSFSELTRKNALINIQFVLKDVHKFVERLTEKLRAVQKTDLAQSIVLTTKIDEAKQVIDSLEAIRSRAEFAAPVDHTSFLNSNNEVIPPHGLIINVENRNAIAWGQVVPEYGRPSHHYLKSASESSAQTNSFAGGGGEDDDGNGDEEKRVWRPMISFDYPYHTVRTLNVPKSVFEESDRPIFGVFHHVAKNVEKKSSLKNAEKTVEEEAKGETVVDGEKEKTPEAEAEKEKEGPTTSRRLIKATATHVALFKAKKDCDKGELEITIDDLEDACYGKPFPLTKTNKDYTEIDIKELLPEEFFELINKVDEEGDDASEIEELDGEGDVELYLAMVAVAAKEDKKSRGRASVCSNTPDFSSPFLIVEDSPLLHLHVHVKDSDEYYYEDLFSDDDDDDDDDSDEDTDDDSDDNDSDNSDARHFRRYWSDSDSDHARFKRMLHGMDSDEDEDDYPFGDRDSDNGGEGEGEGSDGGEEERPSSQRDEANHEDDGDSGNEGDHDGDADSANGNDHDEDGNSNDEENHDEGNSDGGGDNDE